MAARCLCCQQPVSEDGRYHARCLKALWGKAAAPRIPFAAKDLPDKVTTSAEHMSISGVQAKALVRLNEDSGEVEFSPAGSTHILKPEPNEYPGLPAMENACMGMADALAMNVPPHGLFPMADGRLCYIVKRFDRADDGGKIQSETMFQVLGAEDKYKGSLESVGKAIRAHAENVGLDTIDFFERVLLCFLIGNGDMHLKNWAFLIRGKKAALAPVYDFVSSKVYIKRESDTALTINGKGDKLQRADFEGLAKNLKLDPRAAANSFAKMKGAQEKLRELAIYSELDPSMRQEFEDVLGERFRRLFPVGNIHCENGLARV
ncbi:MAG: HipA domain-containing protein [Elusimicrobia bacterium]|nr:HipA domain-containing protein [Elusimicrobiota bacterium]